jgi:protein-arginine kinase
VRINKEFSVIQHFDLNSLLQKPAIYDEKTQVILKEALKNAGAESALQGVARMDVEIQRAVKFLQISTDLRQYQKRAEVSFINLSDKLQENFLFIRMNQKKKWNKKQLLKKHHRPIEILVNELYVVMMPMVISILVHYKKVKMVDQLFYLIWILNKKQLDIFFYH